MDWDWYLVAMGSNVLGVGSNTDRSSRFGLCKSVERREQ